MGDLPDIDATELSSEQGAIYDQIIARPSQARSSRFVAAQCRAAEPLTRKGSLSASKVADLRL